ncbi:MAG TPA: helix-turn-helix transcriptional regulator [Anaerovoracaceae bacterium]|nr:helix-turn-helix transcriptional regulator [Anaerovoracaceae bacterium]
MALTTKIREYRAKYSMRQEELATLVGVRRETIVNLENGRYNPSLKLAMDISKVFSCTVEDLFSFNEEQK